MLKVSKVSDLDHHSSIPSRFKCFIDNPPTWTYDAAHNCGNANAGQTRHVLGSHGENKHAGQQSQAPANALEKDNCPRWALWL